MAYKRKGYGRRSGTRMYKRRRTAARRGNYLNTKIKRTILQQSELKWYNYPSFINGVNASTVWNMNDLPIYANTQGTGRLNRIGTKIFLDQLELQIKIAPVVNNIQSTGSTCRFIVYHVIDHQGTQTPITDILQSFNDQTGLTIAPAYNSPKTLDFYPKRVTVIYDKMHSMYLLGNNAGANFAAGPMWEALITLPVKKHINFIANGGNLADIRGHYFGIAFAADDANCCNILVNLRWRFKDA